MNHSCPPALHPDDIDEFFHCGGGFFKAGFFFGHEFDLKNLFDAFRAELDRHAHEQSIDSVFPFEINGAAQDALAVVEDGVRRLGDGRRRRIKRAPRF